MAAVRIIGGAPSTRRVTVAATAQEHGLLGETNALLFRWASGGEVRIYWSAADAAANINYVIVDTGNSPPLIPARVSSFWYGGTAGAVFEVTALMLG